MAHVVRAIVPMSVHCRHGTERRSSPYDAHRGLLDGVDYHQLYLQAGDPSVYPNYPMQGPPNKLLAVTDTGHAVGRSLDFDGVVREPREHHLLQLWRVDQFEDTQVVRADDPWDRQVYPD
jgi:hypothetical protein